MSETDEQRVERITGELFTRSDTFRQTVVYREMSALMFKSAAIFGIANLVALATIVIGTYNYMKEQVAAETKRVVGEETKGIHADVTALSTETRRTADAETAHIRDNVSKLAIGALDKAIDKIVAMQLEMKTSDQTIRGIMAQATALQGDEKQIRDGQEKLAKSLHDVMESATFFKDAGNVERAADILKFISSNKNVTAVLDNFNAKSAAISRDAAFLDQRLTKVETQLSTLRDVLLRVPLEKAEPIAPITHSH
ncbi:MAG TPA: hypothetical protein VG055_29930 [Planctomycetaceae bacterium]|nr:hypothetical protein [Planctomycetaceae bacterium]